MEEALPLDKQLRNLRIICVAITGFATTFTLLCIYLGQQETEMTGNPEGIRILRIVHLAMTFLVLFVSRIVSARVLAGRSKHQHLTFIRRYGSSLIVQLALFDAAVLFGAVIFMQTPPTIYQSDPTIYLHLISLVLMWLLAMRIYPTEEKYRAAEEQAQVR